MNIRRMTPAESAEPRRGWDGMDERDRVTAESSEPAFDKTTERRQSDQVMQFGARRGGGRWNAERSAVEIEREEREPPEVLEEAM